jgi:hypothetical protein
MSRRVAGLALNPITTVLLLCALPGGLEVLKVGLGRGCHCDAVLLSILCGLVGVGCWLSLPLRDGKESWLSQRVGAGKNCTCVFSWLAAVRI